MPYVDNAPIGVEPMKKEERQDLKEERDQEEYDAMCAQVRIEWAQFKMNGLEVHNEAIHRLKSKYQHMED